MIFVDWLFDDNSGCRNDHQQQKEDRAADSTKKDAQYRFHVNCHLSAMSWLLLSCIVSGLGSEHVINDLPNPKPIRSQ